MLENSETSWARIRGHLKVYILTEMGDKKCDYKTGKGLELNLEKIFSG